MESTESTPAPDFRQPRRRCRHGKYAPHRATALQYPAHTTPSREEDPRSRHVLHPHPVSQCQSILRRFPRRSVAATTTTRIAPSLRLLFSAPAPTPAPTFPARHDEGSPPLTLQPKHRLRPACSGRYGDILQKDRVSEGEKRLREDLRNPKEKEGSWAQRAGRERQESKERDVPRSRGGPPDPQLVTRNYVWCHDVCAHRAGVAQGSSAARRKRPRAAVSHTTAWSGPSLSSIPEDEHTAILRIPRPS
ncbi:hypothetical protein C8R45DRAFT_1103917 [Mycena sanguinolenta]|nr:hypothetical protein C8R45DRAFT_1103917 [Mycena sanguinolenta]